MGLLDRYVDRQIARVLAGQPNRMRVVGSFIHPDLDEIMGIESRTWKSGLGRIAASGTPMMGLGFAGAPLPNTEPVVAPSAVTGGTSEANLYTPATTTNAEWALLPQGSIRAPQFWLINAAGIITSSAGSQTCAFTSRIGTSGTPSSNATLGATGLIALGSTITNALWTYTAMMTIRTPGTSGTAVSTADITVSQQASGSVTSVGVGMSGNTTATIDTTLQQGYVISITPSAAGVSAQLTQFCLIAVD